MPEISLSAAIELLKPFLEAFASRDEKNAAREAGSLMFWRSGMLKQLEAIAGGDETKKTFKELKTNFEESQEDVNATMIRLSKLRGKLVGSSIAHQIDIVLHDYEYGKSMIRSQIEMIVAYGPKGQQQSAREVCNRINTLNAALERLYRTAFDR